MPIAEWQAELAACFTRLDELLDYLRLDPRGGSLGSAATGDFPLRVTRSYAARMRKGDSDDPLLRQVLPVEQEQLELPGYSADPVGDMNAVATAGLLHKYHGRVLLLTTGACAIHCRYCFRRDFPYADGQLSRRREQDALAYIAGDGSIAEVLLSGGDPLVLNDTRLHSLIRNIAAIPHVRRLRIHSRLPVVLPSRITGRLLQTLTETRLTPVLVIHSNHPAEINEEVATALASLRQAGVTLLNQAVLLKGINDSVDIMAALNETLFEHGVMPYYLHLLDKAKGTWHFDVSEETALVLHEQLRSRLPGYLVPTLVREIAGEPYKSWRA